MRSKGVCLDVVSSAVGALVGDGILQNGENRGLYTERTENNQGPKRGVFREGFEPVKAENVAMPGSSFKISRALSPPHPPPASIQFL